MSLLLWFLLIVLCAAGLWYAGSRIVGDEKPFRRSQSRWRELTEDALKHFYKLEMAGRPLTLQSVAGQLHVSVNQAASVLADLKARGLLTVEGDDYHLSPSGAEYAVHIIRAHRLWERYFADRTGLSETEWHDKAEKLEHRLSREAADALAAELGFPTHDPHGDPVPTSKGSLSRVDGRSLLTLEPDRHARIVHVEDEPSSVYAVLVAANIYPGMDLQILERDHSNIRLMVEGEERDIPILAAGNVTVKVVEDESRVDLADAERLSSLAPGEKGTVVHISRSARGTERRRYMDLGILAGTEIEAEFRSPGGDPTAYRVRDALIALRRDQAEQILVRRMEADPL